MEHGHGKSVAALSPDDPFALAFAEYERARDAFIEAAPDAKQFELPEGGHELLCKASEALDAMMRIEAPNIWALFEKQRALATCPWPWAIGDYADRLTADAGTLALQLPKIWLDHWKRNGGYVTVGGDGRGGAGHPTFPFSPQAHAYEAAADANKVRENDRLIQRSWHSAFYDGQMRELSDLLDAVPGLWAGVKAIVSVDPKAGIPETNGREAF